MKMKRYINITKKRGVKANLNERKKKDLDWSNQGSECR